MNPADRARLEQKTEATVARLLGVEMPRHVDPARHVGIIREGGPLVLLGRDHAIVTLAMLGVFDIVQVAEARRPTMSLSVIVLVEDQATVEFIRLSVQRGGMACA